MEYLYNGMAVLIFAVIFASVLVSLFTAAAYFFIEGDVAWKVKVPALIVVIMLIAYSIGYVQAHH